MNNFGTLFGFELKKIVGRKLVLISTAVLLTVAAFSACGGILGTSYVDGVPDESHYDAIMTDMGYARALNGRAIDDGLLREMQAAYSRVPDVDRYSLTEEYRTYARPYSTVHNFAASILRTNGREELMQADAKELYEKRQERLREEWEQLGLSEGEIDYWQQKEQQLAKPFIMEYAGGYQEIGSLNYTTGLMLALLISICLATVFTDEHSRRTDQLILCSRLGRRNVYYAKVLAGAVFALLLTVLFFVFTACILFAVYGADGFGSAVQLMLSSYSFPLTAGQLALILFGILLASAVLHSTFIMILSESIRSSIGAIAVVVGTLILNMFLTIPDCYRVASQLWEMLPSNMASVWGSLSTRLVPFFGGYLTMWQAVPILYLLLSGLIVFLGSRIYRSYQVGGR